LTQSGHSHDARWTPEFAQIQPLVMAECEPVHIEEQSIGTKRKAMNAR